MTLEYPCRTPSPGLSIGMRRRSGFSMFAMVLIIAIVTTLIAISYPVLMRYEQFVRVQQTYDILESVRLATYNATAAVTDPVFRQRVGENPGKISHLFIPITDGNAAIAANSCGNAYTQTANWRLWGPFLEFSFDPAVGLPTPIGIAGDGFIRAGSGANTVLIISMPLVDMTDISMLDRFDNNDGSLAGKIRWNTVVGTTATLLYTFGINGTC
jgi:type II secretory pathway pseudopilin PulG